MSKKNSILSCKNLKEWNIVSAAVGLGGSLNIFLGYEDPNDPNKRIGVKIIPRVRYHNYAIKPNLNDLEIAFYKFLTARFIDTNRTPNIVRLISHIECDNIDMFIKDKLTGSKCYTAKDVVSSDRIVEFENDILEEPMCELFYRAREDRIEKKFDAIQVEYCETSMEEYLYLYFQHLFNDKKESDVEITTYVVDRDLKKFIFQVIFTLAVIKDTYPGYLHGDMFIRNVLLSDDIHGQHDYFEYNYAGKKFYLKADGFNAKINDFGLSVLIDAKHADLKPNVKDPSSDMRLIVHPEGADPMGKKTDVYNFLYSIFDYLKYNESASASDNTNLRIKMIPIFNMLKSFIDIDRLESFVNKDYLYHIWHIDHVPELSSLVKTPSEYLKGDLFDFYSKLPPKGKIINSFNK